MNIDNAEFNHEVLDLLGKTLAPRKGWAFSTLPMSHSLITPLMPMVDGGVLCRSHHGVACSVSAFELVSYWEEAQDAKLDSLK